MKKEVELCDRCPEGQNTMAVKALRYGFSELGDVSGELTRIALCKQCARSLEKRIPKTVERRQNK